MRLQTVSLCADEVAVPAFSRHGEPVDCYHSPYFPLSVCRGAYMGAYRLLSLTADNYVLPLQCSRRQQGLRARFAYSFSSRCPSSWRAHSATKTI